MSRAAEAFEPLVLPAPPARPAALNRPPAALVLPEFGPAPAVAQRLTPPATAAAAETAEAFEAGRRAGRVEAECSREAAAAATLSAVQAALAEAQAKARQVVEEALVELARTLFAMVDAALPGLARTAAPDAIAAFVSSLAPMVSEAAAPRLRVAPSLVPLLAPRLSLPVEADLSLAEGEARLEWRGGHAVFRPDDRRAALRDSLRLLGLLEDNTP
jgi:hypothetical protein